MLDRKLDTSIWAFGGGRTFALSSYSFLLNLVGEVEYFTVFYALKLPWSAVLAICTFFSSPFHCYKDFTLFPTLSSKLAHSTLAFLPILSHSSSIVRTISFMNLWINSFWRSSSRSTFCLNAQNYFFSSATTVLDWWKKWLVSPPVKVDILFPNSMVGNLERVSFFSDISLSYFFIVLSLPINRSFTDSSLDIFIACISAEVCSLDLEFSNKTSTECDRSLEGANFAGTSFLGCRKALRRSGVLRISFHLKCL